MVKGVADATERKRAVRVKDFIFMFVDMTTKLF